MGILQRFFAEKADMWFPGGIQDQRVALADVVLTMATRARIHSRKVPLLAVPVREA
jgi:hypothetical protein